MSVFAATPAPHIRTTDSVAGYYWSRILALIPVLTAAAFQQGFSGGNLLAALLAAVFGEILGASLAGRKPSPEDGAGIFYILFGLLVLPAGLSPGTAVLAALLIILAGKEFFGGLGAFFLHPALLVVALLSGLDQIGEGGVPAASGTGCALAALGGSIFLLLRRPGILEMVALYFAMLLLAVPFLGISAPELLINQGVLLCALFVLTDVSLLPLSRAGRRFFSALAAALTVMLAAKGMPLPGAAAFLASGLAVPWLDMHSPVKKS